MEEVKTTQLIFKKDKDFLHLDFEKLRREGLTHIGKFSGKIWTDHNVHDPGVTILEMLVYALMDLGYRTTLPIEDLLALDQNIPSTEDNFFTPAQILTNNPTTILDYRKMLIDIDGVYNAWLEVVEEPEPELWLAQNGAQLSSAKPSTGEPYRVNLNGLYQVYIQLDRGSNYCKTETDLEVKKTQVLAEVKKRLLAHRNLCEDFLEPKILAEEEFGVKTEIELTENADPAAVKVKILEKLWQFFSPEIRFYTLEEMLEKGKTIEEIFEGRPYSKESFGFIDTDELRKIELPREIHVSDLYREILDVEGVDSVQVVTPVQFDPDTGNLLSISTLTHSIKEDHSPVFCIDRSEFKFTQAGFSVEPDPARFDSLLKRAFNRKRARYTLGPFIDNPVPNGTFNSDLGDYYSIQNEFPLVYGIGEGGLGKDVTFERVAQARQLKGYLLFFDHLLASYLSQLSNIRNLFSLKPGYQQLAEHRRTYFSQSLDSVPDIEKLVLFYEGKYEHEEESIMAFPVLATDFKAELEKRKKDPEYQFDFDKIYADFDNVFERKALFEHYFREFNQGADVDIQLWERDDCHVGFCVKTSTSPYVWISDKEYPTPREAKQAAELLSYLGILKENYRSTNDLDAGKFSLEIIFRADHYFEIMKKIIENDTLYQSRRKDFLNHLLARFSERFTDYSLLAYKLEEAKKNERKELLLSEYDRVSRNRGRAFNYSLPSWDTSNTSGVEQKIASLMGIRAFKREFLCGFEVWNGNKYRLFQKGRPGAFYLPQTFAEKALINDTRINEVFNQAANYKFLVIDEGGDNTCLLKERYHYVLREQETEKVLLISFQSFPTEEEAKEAFKKEYLLLIDLASDVKNFSDNATPDKPDSRIASYEEYKNRNEALSTSFLAFIPENSDLSVEELSQAFNSYPIRLAEFDADLEETNPQRYKYFFRLINENGEEQWRSAGFFDQPEMARKAFRVFLSQLRNKNNFRAYHDANEQLYWWGRGVLPGAQLPESKCKKQTLEPRPDDDLNCYYLTLTEVLLESHNFSGGDAWGKEGLQKLLANGINRENYSIINGPDPEKRFSFQVVGEAYRQAIHPQQYNTPSSRDAVKAQLVDCTRKAATTLTRFNEVNTVKVGNQFYFFLKERGKERLWRGVKGYASNARAEAAGESAQYEIMAFAREERFYLTDSTGVIYLSRRGDLEPQEKDGLTQEIINQYAQEGSLLAVHEPAKLSKEALVEKAKHYPITKVPTGYQFKIYCADFEVEVFEDDSAFDKTVALRKKVKGAVIWQSVNIYEKEEAARNALDAFFDKFEKVNGYAISEHLEDHYGPFSYEMVDQSEVLAKHPQEYELFTDVNDAIDRSITRINVPGFHLVEHMLLRPRKKIGQNGAEGSASENCFLPVQPDWNSQLDLSAFEEEDFPPEEATERSIFIPCADPYSFTATLILPDWSENYREPAFREAFENIFRKEMPAHIHLKICWLDPKQLCAFEEVYQTWLHGLEGNRCGKKDENANCALVEHFAGLKCHKENNNGEAV